MTFDEAMHLVESSPKDAKVCFDGNPFYIFDHDGMLYCFAADGYSRPIDIDKDISDAAKELPWFATEGMLDFKQAMIAVPDYGGMMKRVSWGEERGIRG